VVFANLFHKETKTDRFRCDTVKLKYTHDPGRVLEALDIERAYDGLTKSKPREPAYALFPAQQDRKNPGRLSTGGSFTLTVSGISADLEAALWAWVTFGGYGARTRRAR
jgi:CRISPR/Cas system CMR-associated protein Cmr1 (group 7 of RAMP superfamily)